MAQIMQYLPAMKETQFESPKVRKIPWRRGIAAHSSTLARDSHGKEPSGLWSTKSQRVGHD